MPDTPFYTWVVLEKSLSIPVSRHGLSTNVKRRTGREKAHERREGRIDNAIGGGLHRWPLFGSAILYLFGPFVRALRDS